MNRDDAVALFGVAVLIGIVIAALAMVLSSR